jgi:hypothetical protein
MESHERARTAFRAWRERPNGDQPYLRATPAGEVRIRALRLVEIGGHEVLEVTVGEPSNGDPSFRVVNPPTLVKEPDGSYREDPLAALAQVIGEHGGAARRKRSQR